MAIFDFAGGEQVPPAPLDLHIPSEKRKFSVFFFLDVVSEVWHEQHVAASFHLFTTFFNILTFEFI